MKHHNQTPHLPALIADSTLGKLAKWLRLAGMDTRLDPSTPDRMRLEPIAAMEQRVVLTRTTSIFQKIRSTQCLFIKSNDVMDQVRQVIDELHIQQHHLRILTRCATCNHPLSQIHGNDLRGRVPDYIFQQYESLMTCTKCQRIYWPGTHAARINSIVDGWFSKTIADEPNMY